MPKGKSIPYSAEEMAWIEEHREFTRRDLHRFFVMFFGRDDVKVDDLKALCSRKGWKTGRTGCFPKGNVPFNRGRKGYSPPGSELGWFTKGKRRGAAVDLYKPIGTERVSKDGYLERKINDEFPAQRRWKTVHTINWEAVNGPVPKGYALKCLDSNKQNTDPSNWEAIPRALLPRLTGKAGRYRRVLAYDDASPELKPTVMAIAKLSHKARVRQRKLEEAES